MTTRILSLTIPLFLALAIAATADVAEAVPRVLSEVQLPNDARLEALKDLDGYFPFTPPASQAAWEKRAGRVRRQILVSQGLWPMPTRTPLNAVIHGKIERDEYTVEKVYFESAPGFFVTGNLYRPKNVTGKVPGVLFAHGHWKDARLSESGDAELHIDAGKVNTLAGWRDVKVAVFAVRERGSPATSGDYEQRDLPAPSVRSVIAAVEEVGDFRVAVSGRSDPSEVDRSHATERVGRRGGMDLEPGGAAVRWGGSGAGRVPRRATPCDGGSGRVRRWDGSHRLAECGSSTAGG